MNATAEKCRFPECKAPVRWVTTAMGRSMPLNVDPVPPGTRGALVLIGERAFGLADAVQRLAEMFDVDEAEAHRMAMEEYVWHLSHFATCPKAQQARRRR